ncbi:MAG: adhesin [Bacteroidota bacterium]
MPVYNRVTLKNFFKNGSSPTQAHFWDLIDSSINKIDDGFAKGINDGLQLSPLGKSKKLMSFYENVRDEKADWQVLINPKESVKGLSVANEEGKSSLFFDKSGKIGVNTVKPQTRLDVRGTTASKARIGTYAINQVPADAQWHSIVDGLTGCHCFEIVAKAEGAPKKGRYAMAHAIAVSCYGAPSSKVKITQSFYGHFRHRIKFRWRGSAENYRLEMKTLRHYNDDSMIRYHVCNLWDDQVFKR